MPVYSVVLEGRGIRLRRLPNIAASGHVLDRAYTDRPIIGFFTHRIVRASDGDTAISKAKRLVTELWSQPPYKEINEGEAPYLSVHAIARLGFVAALFKRQNEGHTFYSGPDERNPGEAQFKPPAAG